MKAPREILVFRNGAAFVARVHIISGERSYAIEADGSTRADAMSALRRALSDALGRVYLVIGGDVTAEVI